MRDIAPTRSAMIELADERRLMRQGYEFLDEKRMLLASEMLRQLRDYEDRLRQLAAGAKEAADALAAAVERHGLDQLQVYPAPEAPVFSDSKRTTFLGIALLWTSAPPRFKASGRAAVNPSPEAEACRAAFERLLWNAADIGLRASNLMRLAYEYRRTERRAKALEKVLLPEVEEAMKRIDEQLDSMEREEALRSRLPRLDSEIIKGGER